MNNLCDHEIETCYSCGVNCELPKNHEGTHKQISLQTHDDGTYRVCTTWEKITDQIIKQAVKEQKLGENKL